MIGDTPEVSLTVLILAVVGSGAFTTFISWLLYRGKSEAETEGIVVDTYSQVLGDMRTELTRYQKLLDAAYARIGSLEREVRSNNVRIRVLETTMRENSIDVPEGPPTPPGGQPSLWGLISGEEDNQEEGGT